MSLKKDNKHVAVTEFSLWMMNKGTEELKGTNTECMAEHRNEVLIVFSLSLSLAFVYTCIDIVSVGTMHVIKHTFIPSFWKLTIVILIKSKHACTSRPNQTDFNNLLKAAAEWTFFSITIFVTQLPGKPAAPIISHNKHCYQGSRPYFSHFCQTLSGCSAFWKMNDHYKFRNTFWAMKVCINVTLNIGQRP